MFNLPPRVRQPFSFDAQPRPLRQRPVAPGPVPRTEPIAVPAPVAANEGEPPRAPRAVLPENFDDVDITVVVRDADSAPVNRIAAKAYQEVLQNLPDIIEGAAMDLASTRLSMWCRDHSVSLSRREVRQKVRTCDFFKVAGTQERRERDTNKQLLSRFNMPHLLEESSEK